MKESRLSKITASVAVAKGMAQKALAASPNPQWTEYEMQSVDEWIARQDVKLDRPEAIRRLVEMSLKSDSAPKPARNVARSSRAAELAAKAIDKLGDPAASTEEHDERRRHLTKGPPEFREDRVDRPKVTK
jgi:hypothetical protein